MLSSYVLRREEIICYMVVFFNYPLIRSKANLTMIELLAVLIIIALIASIVIPNIGGMTGEANITAIHNNIRNIQTAVDMYSLDNNGNYPTSEKPTEFTLNQ